MKNTGKLIIAWRQEFGVGIILGVPKVHETRYTLKAALAAQNMLGELLDKVQGVNLFQIRRAPGTRVRDNSQK